MSALALLASLAFVQLLAAMSPGPSFALVVSRAATGDRRRAAATAAGILAATALWIVLAAAGAGALLAAAPALFAACRVAGALYLIWTGAKMLRGALARGAAAPLAPAPPPGLAACWRQGLLTNLANPKSVAYYTSLFVAMLPPDASPALLLAAGATAWATSALWWFGLAAAFTTPAMARAFLRMRRAIDAAMGAVMVALGLRLLASR